MTRQSCGPGPFWKGMGGPTLSLWVDVVDPNPSQGAQFGMRVPAGFAALALAACGGAHPPAIAPAPPGAAPPAATPSARLAPPGVGTDAVVTGRPVIPDTWSL